MEETNERLYFDPPLWRQRRMFTTELIKASQLESVLDVGCGEGALLEVLANSTQFTLLGGIDSDRAVLHTCQMNCSPRQDDYSFLREREIRIDLYHGSCDIFDQRLQQYDAVAMLECIEHLDEPVLKSFPPILFGYQPKLVIISTPNSEFNVKFPDLRGFRHWDHRFEWTRSEFESWGRGVAAEFGYEVTFSGVGTLHNEVYDNSIGFCTQIAVFKLCIGSGSMPSFSSLSFNESQGLKRIGSIVFPHFEENFSTHQMIDEIIEHLVPNGEEKTLSFEELWSVLRIRQVCKTTKAMVDALNLSSNFQVLENHVRILYTIIPPPPFIHDPSLDSDPDKIIEDTVMVVEEDWGETYDQNPSFAW